MTKKDKILKVFKESVWIEGTGSRSKIITWDQFNDIGLYGTLDNASQYCDIIYARRVLQKLGYRVLIGGAMHVYVIN